MRAGKRSCTRFLLVDGGGVIKRLSALCSERRKSEVEERGEGGGAKLRLMKATLPIFNLESLSLSPFDEREERKRFRCKLTRLDRRFFRSPFPIDHPIRCNVVSGVPAIHEFATIKESFDAPCILLPLFK